MVPYDELKSFVMWMNGVVDITGDAPTPGQWAVVKDKIHEMVGKMVADRMREAVDSGYNSPLTRRAGTGRLHGLNPPLTMPQGFYEVSAATPPAWFDVRTSCSDLPELMRAMADLAQAPSDEMGILNGR